jgi:L-alanine-DL-glutamate epimerase-like enolase superfamily enzyme
MGEHGQWVAPPIARITTDEGATGFGWSRITRERAAEWIGLPVQEMYDPEHGMHEAYRGLEFPLWDLAGQLAEKPVYALLAGRVDNRDGYGVPCYDTSLYMDDLHLEDDEAAAALIANEALQGAARGHWAFKIKVGRGALHMPLEAGTQRDIRVIRAVRGAVGAEARILIDANNGYNVNLVKRVLTETASAGVYWIEEPFHEDARLYGHLKEWLAAQGLEVLIADGEGSASPHLLEWARQGLIDVVQYDIRNPGFSRWLKLGSRLDGWGVRSAPHNYGGPYGNYAACHVAARIRHFEFVEWDEAKVPGLDASAYSIVEGYVRVPDLPGFGLRLDEEVYARAVEENGYVVS